VAFDEELPAEPDLRGLSCEWNPFESRRGTILSLLVEPTDEVGSLAFGDVARRLISVFERDNRGGSPVPTHRPARKDGSESVDPATWADVALNSDFRKFDDVLRLTVDCTFDEVNEIEEMLRDASAQGVLRYGSHCQSHAIMTCLVPGADASSHLHFLDGYDGGYSKAAEILRNKQSAPISGTDVP